MGLQLKIEIWFRQLRKFHLARDREGTARQVAVEALEVQSVARESHPGMEPAERRQGRVGEPRHVDGDVAGPAQDRFRDRAVDVHVKGEIAVELGDAREKLPEKIHGAARHLHLGGQRRLFIKPLFFDHLRNVERNIAGNQDRLDFGLLEPAVESELVVLQLRHEIERGRLELGILGAVEIAHLHVEPAGDLRQGSVRVELHIDQAGAERRRAQVREKLFQIQVLGLKRHQHFAVGGKERVPGADVFPNERQ